MPLQATSGAASYDAFGGGVVAEPNYIESCFSTYLYTGTGSALTITNGIDLSTKGGLVWIKDRSVARSHVLYDTARGVRQSLATNLTAATIDQSPDGVTAFNTTGFSLGGGGSVGDNTSGDTYASWTFRKQPKFFDVVTWSGTGSNRTIAHNLGSVPGSIIVKRTDTAANWAVYHRSLANTQYLVLNSTAAGATGATWWNSTTPTSTVFSLGTDASVNASGGTYVAYIYAHDAGGFGLTGTDNVISCSSFTTDGSGNATVNLGYEPQWILFKNSSSTGPWYMLDTFRQWSLSEQNYLTANTSNTESPVGAGASNYPTATGFNTTGAFTDPSSTYIYIAIRRGPMKVPTSGTSVFNPAYGTGATGSFDTSFPVDMGVYSGASISTGSYWSSRLTASKYLTSFNTNAEATFGSTQPWDRMEDWYATADNRFIGWGFRRAPSFFDEVCYTGAGTSSSNNNHNLAVVPELIIVKERNFGGTNWRVYSSALGNTKEVYLNQTNASTTTTSWASTTPTASVFTVGVSGGAGPNDSGSTYVAYLFATCAGVSKVGSYTGNGTTQTINCGFTGGARFVLLKATSTTGNWYVYDTARGMTTLTDPYLLLNSTAAESATLGSVTTVSTGFALNAGILAAINTNGASYIFLAIA